MYVCMQPAVVWPPRHTYALAIRTRWAAPWCISVALDVFRPDTHEGSELDIVGGDFTCRSIRRGAVLFAGDSTNVTITGGVMANSVAGTRGGAVSKPGDYWRHREGGEWGQRGGYSFVFLP